MLHFFYIFYSLREFYGFSLYNFFILSIAYDDNLSCIFLVLKLNLSSKDRIYSKIRHKPMGPEIFTMLSSYAKALQQQQNKASALNITRDCNWGGMGVNAGGKMG